MLKNMVNFENTIKCFLIWWTGRLVCWQAIGLLLSSISKMMGDNVFEFVRFFHPSVFARAECVCAFSRTDISVCLFAFPHFVFHVEDDGRQCFGVRLLFSSQCVHPGRVCSCVCVNRHHYVPVYILSLLHSPRISLFPMKAVLYCINRGFLS